MSAVTSISFKPILENQDGYYTFPNSVDVKIAGLSQVTFHYIDAMFDVTFDYEDNSYRHFLIAEKEALETAIKANRAGATVLADDTMNSLLLEEQEKMRANRKS